MELISFMLLFSISLAFILIGKFGNSSMMSIFGSLFIIMLAVNVMVGSGSGLQYQTGETINATNDTAFTYSDVFSNGLLNNDMFGLSLTLVGLYILLASVFSLFNFKAKLPF